MKMTVTMTIVGGLIIAGFAYFIRNPDKFKMVKDIEENAMYKLNKISE